MRVGDSAAIIFAENVFCVDHNCLMENFRALNVSTYVIMKLFYEIVATLSWFDAY